MEARLPAQYTKVVWIDSDILIPYNNWLAETSKALDRLDFVQPYKTCCQLGPSFDRNHCGYTKISFGYDRTQHPGYVVGVRRDLLKRIGGGFLGDYVIAGTIETNQF